MTSSSFSWTGEGDVLGKGVGEGIDSLRTGEYDANWL